MKARIQNGLNAAANWFKRLKEAERFPDVRKMVKAKEDVYDVVCIDGAYHPLKNGNLGFEYPNGKVVFVKSVKEYEKYKDDGVIVGFPSNAQAIEFINDLKAE